MSISLDTYVTVPCALCKQPVGKPCVNRRDLPRGAVRTEAHSSRIRAYLEWEKKHKVTVQPLLKAKSDVLSEFVAKISDGKATIKFALRRQSPHVKYQQYCSNDPRDMGGPWTQMLCDKTVLTGEALVAMVMRDAKTLVGEHELTIIPILVESVDTVEVE